MDFRKIADDVHNTLVGFRGSTGDWKEAKKTDDCTVYYKNSPEFGGYLYKSEGIIDKDPETVMEHIEPKVDGKRLTWDKTMKELECIEEIDKDLRVVRTSTHAAAHGIISCRDFVDLVKITRDADGTVVTNARSIVHPDVGDRDGYVRGHNYTCGTFCSPIDGNRTKLTRFLHADLKGLLPQAVVGSALPSTINEFYGNLKTALSA